VTMIQGRELNTRNNHDFGDLMGQIAWTGARGAI